MMKIGQLLADMRNVDIRFRVITKGEIRTIQSQEGKELKLSEVIVGDETGRIILTLWDHMIDVLKEGEIGEVKNGFIKVINNELRLNVGKYGQLTKIDDIKDFAVIENIPNNYPKPPSNYNPILRKRFPKKY